MTHSQCSDSNEQLLSQFNEREKCAFEKIYDLYYFELIYFTKRLYHCDSSSASDIVHDILIKIWSTNKLKFETIRNIKAYLYISIKNGFLDFISHNKCVDKYVDELKKNPDNFVSEIIEVETLSVITDCLNFVPEESAKIFKLLLDGWDVKDISKKMNRSQSYIYVKRDETIKLLRNKLNKNKLFLFWIPPIM